VIGVKLSRKIAFLFTASWTVSAILYLIYSKVMLNFFMEENRELCLKYSIIILVISSLLIHIIVYHRTNVLIKKKLRALNKEISMINTNNNPKGRIQENIDDDEFSILAKDLNNMFQSIEDSNKLMISNEKKYSRLVEGLDNGYAYFKILRDNDGNVKDAFVVEVNMSLANMFRMEKEELMAGSFSKIFKTYIKDTDIVPKVLRCVGGKNQYVIRNSVRLGVDKWAYLTVYPIETEYFAMIITDISENKKFAEEMKHIANYDVLTNIPNRYSLYNDMEKLKANNEPFTIFYMDLDNFKTINDTLGHDVGDEVLCRAAETVQRMGNENFYIGRLGGDEFLIIFRGQHSIEDVKNVGNDIIKELNAVVSYNNYPYKIKPSIGASRFIDDTDNIEVLLKYADVAMYKTKKGGGNNINVFDKSMLDEVMVEVGIKEAIENQELTVYYQPIYNLGRDSIIGAEALVRWHKDSEIIEPSKFIAIAKRTGDIADIDNFVLKEACKFCSKKRNEEVSDFKISVNASYKFLKQPDFMERLNKVLIDTKLDPKALRFEITEDEVIEDMPEIIKILEKVKKLGIEVALDDFGVGYSSFGYIKVLPIDSIKIDKSLILNGEDEGRTMAIVASMIQLAHTLDLDVIAEGVEIQEQLNMLKSLDCDNVQGYLFSKPVPKDSFPQHNNK
jgi:diguanylate cyclase (GGDEF)-like protein